MGKIPYVNIREAEPIAETDLATASPVMVDARMARLDDEVRGLEFQFTSSASTIRSASGDRQSYVSRVRKEWGWSLPEAIEKVRAAITSGAYLFHGYSRGSVENALTRLDEAQRDIGANRAEYDALETEYNRRPWRRYVNVQGGHIHHGITCAGGTIRPTTQLGWQPGLAGRDVATAVSELGPLLCSHCFPDAPVEWQQSPEDVKAKARCAGSGRPEVGGTFRRQGMSGFGKCQECGTHQTVTGRGVIRAHKPPKDGAK